jgi:hypothetical protein
MRIVDRATFLAQPAGTLFAKYQPHSFGELAIKGDTVHADFYVQELLPWPIDCHDSGQYFDWLETIDRGETSRPLDYDIEARDGLFDEDQRFAILDHGDVEALIARLQKAQIDCIANTARRDFASGRHDWGSIDVDAALVPPGEQRWVKLDAEDGKTLRFLARSEEATPGLTRLYLGQPVADDAP